MEVYGQIPSMFIYSNRKTSKESTTSAVIVGKAYLNDVNIEENIDSVAEGIVEAFSHEGFDLSVSDAREFVLSKAERPQKEKFVLKGGEFVVVKTEFEGGGTGMGPHDNYPDGYKVYCKRLKDGKFDENGEEIHFYQSGCFSVTITDIKPVRTLKMKFE